MTRAGGGRCRNRWHTETGYINFFGHRIQHENHAEYCLSDKPAGLSVESEVKGTGDPRSARFLETQKAIHCGSENQKPRSRTPAVVVFSFPPVIRPLRTRNKTLFWVMLAANP